MDHEKEKWERHFLNLIPCTETELEQAVAMSDEELELFLRQKIKDQEQSDDLERGDSVL